MPNYNHIAQLLMAQRNAQRGQPRNAFAAPLPMRPVDRVMQNRPSPEGMAAQRGLLEQMLLERNPDLGMQPAPTLAQIPQELKIGIDPEWRARSDERLARLQGMGNPRAARAQAQREAYRQKMRQHSIDYESPEQQAEVEEMWRRWHEARS